MKTQYFFGCMLLSIALLSACRSSPLEKRATGLAYEIVVTMDPEIWNSEAGKAVKAELLSDVPGLPQSEPSMRVTYAQPKDFNGLLTYVRNILVVKVDPNIYTKATLTFQNDEWAKGQTVATLTLPDKETLMTYLNENPRILVGHFTQVELDRAAALLDKTFSVVVMDSVKKKFGCALKAPENMYYSSNSGAPDFFWASNNAQTGRTDIVVYTFPYTDPNTFTMDYLVAKRDSFMKAHMPGSYPDSYMTTETRETFNIIDYTPITLNGKYCGVMRGLWRMQGDMMGGPFVSHTRLDEANNRVVVVEAFVYSPESDKRNYMRRAEAALYTLRLPGEFDEASTITGKKTE